MRRRGFSSSLIGAAMSVGGAFTQYLTGVLLESYGIGWRAIFVAYSFVGILWAGVFYAVFRTLPEEHPRVNDAELNLIHDKRAQSQLSRTAESRPVRGAGARCFSFQQRLSHAVLRLGG